MSAVKLITPCEKCNNDFELYYLGTEFPEEMREKILCIDCLFTGDCGRGSRRYRCSDMSCKKCFLGSFASCEKSRYWHYQKNSGVSPRNVAKNTHTKYWFKCETCKHAFENALNNAKNGQWCPYCSIPNKKLCKEECAFCYNRSFASHEKAVFWDYQKNEKSPREIAKSSIVTKYWFKCEKCGHGFDMNLGSITNGSQWCPYCGGKKLCKDDCISCFKRSFASHEKAVFWDYQKNEKSPREISKSANMKYWFKCQTCRHGFDMRLGDITNGGCWCPYCSIPIKKLCKDDCSFCYNRSFASHEKSNSWDYEKNEKTPKQVAKSTDDKYWFKCQKCKHCFDIRLSDITNGGCWCPYCGGKKLCEDDCSFCYERSFASHEKSNSWDYEKNKKTPREVARSSHKK